MIIFRRLRVLNFEFTDRYNHFPAHAVYQFQVHWQLRSFSGGYGSLTSEFTEDYNRYPTPAGAQFHVFNKHCNLLPAPAGAQFRVDRWLKLFSGASGESITRFLKITIGFQHLRELDFLFNKNWDCLPAPAGAQFRVYWWLWLFSGAYESSILR